MNLAEIRAIPLPVAPPELQERIVAEIEQQLTRLDAGVAALRRSQANLKRYRAAVLKAACEGRLVPTEAELARRDGREGDFETGEALLVRILGERREHWKGRGNHKEYVAPGAAEPESVPEGWTRAALDALAEIKGGITKDRNRKHTGPARSVPYLRVANV
jgi:type I restriction enzyme S subunit